MLRKLSILGLSALLLTGCSSGTAAAFAAPTPTATATATVTPTAAPVPTPTPTPTPENLQTADGYYLTSLISQGNSTGNGYVRSISVEGNVLMVDGEEFYDPTKGHWDNTTSSLGDGTFSFLVDENTQYVFQSGWGHEVHTQQEFLDYAAEVLETNLALRFTVVNGVVTEAVIAS